MFTEKIGYLMKSISIFKKESLKTHYFIKTRIVHKEINILNY